MDCGNPRNSQNSRTSMLRILSFLRNARTTAQPAKVQGAGHQPRSRTKQKWNKRKFHLFHNGDEHILPVAAAQPPQQAALAVNRAESIPFTHSHLAVPLNHSPYPLQSFVPWSSEWRMESRDRTIWIRRAEAGPLREHLNMLHLNQPRKITMRTWPPVLSSLAKANDSTGKEKAWPVVVTRREG